MHDYRIVKVASEDHCFKGKMILGLRFLYATNHQDSAVWRAYAKVQSTWGFLHSGHQSEIRSLEGRLTARSVYPSSYRGKVRHDAPY